MQPSPEEIRYWQSIATKRKAILPFEFQYISKKEITIICGMCKSVFTRPLILGQTDVIYVCPGCKSRNYIPIEWDVKLVKFKRRFY